VAEARTLNDTAWVRSLFGRGGESSRDQDFRNLRRWSNSRTSFADTTLGGSQAINAPPQFSLLADPPLTGVFAQPYDARRSDGLSWLDSQEGKGSYRQGLYYSETIEQNSTYLHCRFGKPRYLGMAAFFANMYDPKLSYMARTGDYPGVIRAVSAYVTAAAVWAAVGTVAFAAILIIPRVIAGLLDKQASRYYYVKPTMHLYLHAVQNILNTQLIHRRLVPTGIFGYFQVKGDTDSPENEYHAEREQLYSALPSIWKDNGEFDVYKMINRYQTLANYQARTLDKITSTPDISAADAAAQVEQFYREATYSLTHLEAAAKFEVGLGTMEKVYAKSAGYYAGFDESLEERQNAARGQLEAAYKGLETAGEGTGAEPNADDVERARVEAELAQSDPNAAQTKPQGEWSKLFGDYADMATEAIGDFATSISEQALSEIKNGAQWASWKVDARDGRSYSFSNTTKEPEISSMVNSATAKARSLEVNMSGGLTGFDPLDALTKGIGAAFTGALDTLHLTGLMALYNASVIDFPEVWDSSSMSGDDFSFTIPCRAWSGNDLDIFQDIIVPVAFWLAAVAPLSTGKQSFTHPFYLEAYSRGRFSGRNCIVSSLSLNFGVGGLGWRPGDNVPLSCDINVTIHDMSRNFHMPIVTDPSVFDTDNKFSEFMAVLGAASLNERTSPLVKNFDLSLAQWKQSWKSAFTVGARVNQIFDLPPARFLANILGVNSR